MKKNNIKTISQPKITEEILEEKLRWMDTHNAWDFKKDPLEYILRKEEKDDTAGRIWDRQIVSLMRDRCVFDGEYSVEPTTYVNKKGEEKPWHNGADFCKEWQKEQRELNKEIITHSQYENLKEAKEMLVNSKFCPEIFPEIWDMYSIGFGMKGIAIADKIIAEPSKNGDLVDYVSVSRLGTFHELMNRLKSHGDIFRFLLKSFCYIPTYKKTKNLSSSQLSAGYLVVQERNEPYQVAVIHMDKFSVMEAGFESIFHSASQILIDGHPVQGPWSDLVRIEADEFLR